MKLSYDDVRDFKNILTALAKLVDEASLKINPDGVELVAIDRAHISLVRLQIPKEAFKDYDVQEEFNFGFNTQYLLKILSAPKKKESMELEAEDPSQVIIRISGGINRDYIIRNLDVSPPEVPELNLEFDVKASINSSGFNKAVGQISSVSDTILFKADENGITLRSKSETDVEVEFAKESGGLQDIEISKPAESTYSCDYLDDILALTKLSGLMKISFSDQKPLQIQFNMESGGNVIYLLAPQMG